MATRLNDDVQALLSLFESDQPPLRQVRSNKISVWAPPLAAAEVALDQLVFSIHKRPFHIHLTIIPRLFTAQWRKLLGKICNLNFTVPIDSDI